MKKSYLIIGGLVAAGIVTFLIVKKKKANAAAGITGTGGSTTSGTTTTATTAKGTVGTAIRTSMRDNSQGKLIVQVPESNDYKVNDSVKLSDSAYPGTYKIWYMYHGKSGTTPVMNLYLDVPYTTPASGTVVKA